MLNFTKTELYLCVSSCFPKTFKYDLGYNAIRLTLRQPVVALASEDPGSDAHPKWRLLAWRGAVFTPGVTVNAATLTQSHPLTQPTTATLSEAARHTQTQPL